jgi:hypothetical protein
VPAARYDGDGPRNLGLDEHPCPQTAMESRSIPDVA